MEFDQYDPDLASLITTNPAGGGGLPDYLGIRTTDIGLGTMTAEITIRPELLNAFGTVHGGVLAALTDHVLGAILYPVIPEGSWAATTQLHLNFTAPIKNGTLTPRAARSSRSPSAPPSCAATSTTATGLAGAAQGTVTVTQPR